MLASKEKINDLTVALEEHLNQSDRETTAEAPPCLDLTDEPSLKIEDWTDGVEEYKFLTKDKLWEMLGLSGKSIPLLNDKQDLCGTYDPWVDTGREWFSIPENGHPLVPKWHQLVGISKMLDNFFSSKPTLLMDDVGLGKTLQVVGFFAMLALYRDHHEKNGYFPGKFSKCFQDHIFSS